MKLYVIIVAGGKGIRLGGDTPKQFRLLSGKPIIMHTIEAFEKVAAEVKIILVLPLDHVGYWGNLCKDFSFKIPHTVVAGGQTRWQSVKNGLKYAGKDGLIAVHDGVRPLVSADIINRAAEAAEEFGSAVPVIEVTDSLRIVDNFGESKSVDRYAFRCVQTPQIFSGEILIDAYNVDFCNRFTDDASVVEASGKKLHLIDGDPKNIKITTQKDILLAELLLTEGV